MFIYLIALGIDLTLLACPVAFVTSVVSRADSCIATDLDIDPRCSQQQFKSPPQRASVGWRVCSVGYSESAVGFL